MSAATAIGKPRLNAAVGNFDLPVLGLRILEIDQNTVVLPPESETDLALVFNLAPEADIERAAVVEQKLMAIMHTEHPLANNAIGALRLRDCAEYPVVLSNRDTGGRQLLKRFLARSSTKLNAMVESNSFEFLRGCLDDRHSISFQMAVGAAEPDRGIVARDIRDRGFPRGEMVLANLRRGHLPVIAHSFAEFLRNWLPMPD